VASGRAGPPGRLLLGIGVGHREVTSAYTQPYQALTGYLDALDAAGVPAGRRVLAALGPKVLRLSGQRSAGAHPYLVTPEYSRRARAILGDGPLLAPEAIAGDRPLGRPGRLKAIFHSAARPV
jgi:probable F420-dependent oxidoreductase